MIEHRQQAYLDAMGIETWCLRNPPVVAEPMVVEPVVVEPVVAETVAEIPATRSTVTDTAQADAVAAQSSPVAERLGLKLGPGRGGVLLVCAEDTESASRLANDINRAMGGTPVWGWPHTGEKALGLADAIEENLYTTVGIFGEQLGRQFFAGGLPQNLNSANLVMLPSMRELEADAEARKALWNALCRFGMVSCQ